MQRNKSIIQKDLSKCYVCGKPKEAIHEVYYGTANRKKSIKFDSKKEANRYKELRLLRRAGKIDNLRLQVPYVLIDKSKHGRAIKYIADFVYYDNDLKKEIVEDTKGYRTDLYKLKRRLVAERYDIEIKEL